MLVLECNFLYRHARPFCKIFRILWRDCNRTDRIIHIDQCNHIRKYFLFRNNFGKLHNHFRREKDQLGDFTRFTKYSYLSALIRYAIVKIVINTVPIICTYLRCIFLIRLQIQNKIRLYHLQISLLILLTIPRMTRECYF